MQFCRTCREELPTHFLFVKLMAFIISQIFKLKSHVRLYVVEWLLWKQCTL
jgi:hypothetical protein